LNNQGLFILVYAGVYFYAYSYKDSVMSDIRTRIKLYMHVYDFGTIYADVYFYAYSYTILSKKGQKWPILRHFIRTRIIFIHVCILLYYPIENEYIYSN